MKEISPIQFFKVYQKNANIKIIDVRDTYDYERYHLNDSVNIPIKLLYERHYLFLNKKYSYFILCKNGELSKKATAFLETLGYNVVHVIGGLDRWMGAYSITSTSY